MKKLTLITTILAITVQSFCQWTPQDIDTDAQLTDVFFLNEHIGWVAGNIPPETGIIFKTTNGGITWDSIASVPFGEMELQFIDSLTGWGNLTWNFIEDGIYKTEDGGFTWELIVSGGSEVEFFNENEGVLLDHDNPFPLYSSSDGGSSWDLIDTLVGENISGMGCMDFINTNVGFVVKRWQVLNQTGVLLVKTSDGGFTWEPKSCVEDASDFIFFNENIGYLYNGGYQSGLYKTTDGADYWEKVYDGSVNSVFFSTPEKGWIATYDAIKYTWDGGLTWEMQYSGNAGIHDIFFTDSLCGWAIGQDRLILHTSNGGGINTGLDQEKPDIKSFKIYPNPVSVSTNIEFTLAEPGMVAIDIYNSIGEKVSQPALQAFPKGLHRLEWNAADLEEGTYFCRFKTANKSKTKKLIKVR